MKNIRLIMTACLVAITLQISPEAKAVTGGAPGGPFGLGIILGEPTGITGKYFMNQDYAIDGGLSFDFARWFLVYGDWLYHMRGGFGSRTEVAAATTPYFGLGGLVVVSTKSDFDIHRERYFTDSSANKIAMGLRIPIGIEWRAPTIPLGIFAEIVPGITIIPGTYGFIQGGIGARFYF
jgi:hypothetical protein